MEKSGFELCDAQFHVRQARLVAVEPPIDGRISGIGAGHQGVEDGPKRVWVRWTYFDIDEKGNLPVIRGTDDFISYANGIVWRRQTYRSFYPDRHEAQCASPLDFFAAIPAGIHYSELLPKDEKYGDHLVGAFVDAYSGKQYNVYWDKTDKPKWDGPFYARRTGAG